LNPRLAIQQGLFLAAGNLEKSFEQNFAAVQGASDANRVLKITIRLNNLDAKKDILRRLHRMNINRATLFPGLDGFAQWLKSLVAMQDVLLGRYPLVWKNLKSV
jgi:hypothetical protein